MTIDDKSSVFISSTNNSADSNSNNSLLEKTIDFVFNNKTLVLVLLLFVLGFLFRVIAAVNVEPNADEMVHGSHAPGVIASGVIGRVWQSISWSYMTDLSNNLFGITMFSSRFLSVLFGSLTILLVFLLGRELFNRKTALIATFLIAFSSYHIVYTLIEMDIMVIFLILLSALFFIKRLNSDGKLSMLSAVFLGVAVLVKTLALFFVIPFILGFFIHNKNKKIFSKEIIIQVVKFGLIILLFLLPMIIHNYLWFKDSQMVDAYLSQYFDVGNSREFYSTIQGISDGFRINEIPKGTFDGLRFLWELDPAILLLGLSSLLYFTYRREKHALFFLLFQAIPFFLLVITNRLPTHFAIFSPVFSLYGALLLSRADDSLKKNYNNFISKRFLAMILLLVVIINLFVMIPYIGSRSAVSEVRSFINSNADENTVVVVDARTYRGRIMWAFMGTHYLESSYFPQILALNQNISEFSPVNQYNFLLVECAADDCGWGTIAQQPEFNASTELLFSQLKPQLQQVAVFNGGGSPDVDSDSPYFIVYGGSIALAPQVISAIDSTHNFFYYPAFYTPKSQVLDYYVVNGFFDNMLFLLAKIIIWLSIILSILGGAFVIYKSWKILK